MTLDAWNVRVDATWLGAKRRREAIQNEVDRLLRSVGGATPFPRFGALRDRLIVIGQYSAWFSCSATIGICGELLLCAESGGTMNDAFVPDDPEQAHACEALRHLRNAACHPAHVSGRHSGDPHVLQLCNWLRDHNLAPSANIDALRKDFAKLGERWVADHGLGWLEVTGQAFETRYVAGGRARSPTMHVRKARRATASR
jgi:hypothetical protein